MNPSNDIAYIQPLTLTSSWHPIIVTDMEQILEEPKTLKTEPFPYLYQPERLRELAELPHIWATLDPPSLFTSFYNYYEDDRDFTFHGSLKAKELSHGLGVGPVGATIYKIGFTRTKSGGGSGGTTNTGRNRRMHYLLDLRGFLKEKKLPDLTEQYLLAIEIRDFCYEMGIGPRMNFAGMAAAFLRHPDFYPEPRKRVPEFINEKARPHLPGNHYDLFTETGRVYKSARYYDQYSAHHHAALLAPLPESNSIRAKGFTRDSDNGGGRVWIAPDHSEWQTVLREYGLFMVRARIPQYSEEDKRYLPHNMRNAGTVSIPIWSAELPWIEEMGVKLLGIEWALTGDIIDEGIRKFAKWALEETKTHPNFKAALLCTYGLLAQRRSWSRSIRGTGIRKVRWDTQTFSANVALGDTEFHSYGPTNVLQRGIIEAYTRMLTLRYVSRVPRDLQLGLYGDAVIVNVDGRDWVAPTEEPWREKGILTDLEFLHATQFRSQQLTRLPGIRAGMKR